MHPDKETPLLTILGGGPAGLAVGFYAKKASLSFRILEGSGRVGGNAATLSYGPFRYDTGAHRWHDHYPDITREVKELMGDELLQVSAPSQIFSKGRFFDFPLSPLNLLRNLGPVAIARTAAELAQQWLKPNPDPGQLNFRQKAIRSYGQTIAGRFLLGYSEKLWGAPADELSPAISGKRLKGLNLRTLIIEAMRGKEAKTTHLDGSFFYPRTGIGAIPEKLAQACGPQNIWLHARVQKLRHQNSRIQEVELSDGRVLPVQEVVCTLPLTVAVRAIEPPAPANVLAAAGKLQFRHLLLVVLFIDRPSVSPNASLYFPDPELPFTRLYEPRNRSPFMAPEGQTSIVLEIPTSLESDIWQKPGEQVIGQVKHDLARLGLIKEHEVLGGQLHHIPYAYPILRHDSERHAKLLLNYLHQFSNLHLAGRTASFEYTHLHDHFKEAKELISNVEFRMSKMKVR